LALNDKIIGCKEDQEMNRATFEQVVTGKTRLVEQITDLERVETEAPEGIPKTEMQVKDAEVTRLRMRWTFRFRLTFTRCSVATTKVQSNVKETRKFASKGGGHSTWIAIRHRPDSIR
jgi:hypothetical protein